MNSKAKAIGAVFVSLIVLLIGFLYFAAPSVLFRYKSAGSVDPADALFVLLNPLRERGSENSADTFLTLLKQGECNAAASQLPDDQEYREHLCRQEEEHKLSRWTLADRVEETDKIILHYMAYRVDDPSGGYGNTWITVVREGDRWKVSEVESWY